MSRLTKEQIYDELMQLGGVVPQRWTRMEMANRLAELKEARGESTRRGPTPTAYQQIVTKINTHSKRKSDLVKYCTEELKLELTGCETIAQLQRKGLQYAQSLTLPEGRDLVAFGKHAEKSYAELKAEFPDYCQWVLKTSKESNETDARLKRLSTWLVQEAGRPAPSSNEAITPPRKGYPKKIEKNMTAGKGASSSGQDEEIQKMQNTIAALQAEMAAMKGEPRRKKAVASEETDREMLSDLSDSSFLPVNADIPELK
jgi:hypothetical protein